MANRPKVVDLDKKRKTRTGTVWDGERLKLANSSRGKEKEQELELRKKSSNKKKLLVVVALVIAAAMLSSVLINFFSGLGR